MTAKHPGTSGSGRVAEPRSTLGLLDYVDVHLSHVAQMVAEGLFGHLHVALIEVAGITADGALIPSSSVGNNATWVAMADRVILEVNSWQPAGLEGMHDIYYDTALPRTARRSRSTGRPCRTTSTGSPPPGPASKLPHLLDEALSWHVRYLRDGTKQPR